jgi:hypothetical protein
VTTRRRGRSTDRGEAGRPRQPRALNALGPASGAAKRRGPTGAGPRSGARGAGAAAADAREIESLRQALASVAEGTGPPRWNAGPDDVQRSVIQLVLTLVEFIRRVLERQAIRRMETGTLTRAQTEAIGTALMRLEETIREIGAQFNLAPEDLKLDLGPVGKLM